MSRVALIGDFDPDVVAHRAIPPALDLAAKQSGVSLAWDWVGTHTITDAPRQLAGHAGIWCVPGSPYRCMEGALAAIRFARETNRPFLGTCGGFQHALIEIARDVLGIAGAGHAETDATAPALVITPLACSLVEQQGEVAFLPGSHLRSIFDGQVTRERYHCNYGLNLDYRTRLEATDLRFTGFDANGQIRAMELLGHPFFIGTLFQPERYAIAGRSHPLIEAFVRQLHEP